MCQIHIYFLCSFVFFVAIRLHLETCGELRLQLKLISLDRPHIEAQVVSRSPVSAEAHHSRPLSPG